METLAGPSVFKLRFVNQGRGYFTLIIPTGFDGVRL